ncbi:unnamed protein product [Rangifer tarandus platyrhynchus]|uniref:Uncharacterized protein n=1 Tax=Rangifer tarandus platyrhynchus TaxID=3082113 RepID=A0ABN8YJ41_RANTA|nr:unnamed protein product [Rangifer tarandus platyrhynchus]
MEPRLSFLCLPQFGFCSQGLHLLSPRGSPRIRLNVGSLISSFTPFTPSALSLLPAPLLEFCPSNLDLFSAPQAWPSFRLHLLVLALPPLGSFSLGLALPSWPHLVSWVQLYP